MQTARVTGLYIYPVKSCRGISLKEMTLTETGPLFDRKWMLVDEKNQFITLRNFSKLAEIKTAVQGPFLHLYLGDNKILIDINQDCEVIEEVRVWRDTFSAGVEDKSVNESLSDFLNKTVKLVRYQKQSFRDLKNAATDAVRHTMFSDSRPLLLTNQASLDDLNQKLRQQGYAESVMERFRPNIVVEGFTAFSEEQFSDFFIAGKEKKIKLTHNMPCGRCPVVTQDVQTGKVISKETLKILSDYRRDPNSNRIPFGVNLTPENLGTINLGDAVGTI